MRRALAVASAIVVAVPCAPSEVRVPIDAGLGRSPIGGTVSATASSWTAEATQNVRAATEGES
ncbi:MAG: hypothetical protein U9R79_00680 [Armatimonadota bacterium]|nr:hypothetical protein [Armatimonadota bacterium]